MGSFWHFDVLKNWLSLQNWRLCSFKSLSPPLMSMSVVRSHCFISYDSSWRHDRLSTTEDHFSQFRFQTSNVYDIYIYISFQKILTVTFENVRWLAYETSSSIKMRLNTMFSTAVCVIFLIRLCIHTHVHLSSVTIKSKDLKHSIKFILNNTATCSTVSGNQMK